MKKIKRDSQKSSEHQKNDVKLRLLVEAIPQFQEDIKNIRRDFGIPERGFDSDVEFIKWHDKIMKRTEKLSNSEKFQKESKEIEKIKDYQKYLNHKEKLQRKLPLNGLNYEIKTIGEKYILPENFYENQTTGLYPYVTKDKIIPPSNNWAIQQSPEGRKGTTKWFAIKVFAPLSQKELRDAKRLLESMQKHYFPKSFLINARAKEQFDRDLEIFKALVLSRKKNPVKKEAYPEGSYLNIATNQGALSPKQIKSYKKKNNPTGIKITFDEKTTQEIASKYDIKPEAARQAVKRMRDYINDYFGIKVKNVKDNT